MWYYLSYKNIHNPQNHTTSKFTSSQIRICKNYETTKNLFLGKIRIVDRQPQILFQRIRIGIKNRHIQVNALDDSHGHVNIYGISLHCLKWVCLPIDRLDI